MPVPVLAIASLAASVGSSLFGSMQAKKDAQREQEALRQKEARDAARAAELKNVSEVDTARGQNIIRIAKDARDEAVKNAQGAAAVGGATDASVAMAKEAGNKMISEATAQLAAGDTARQDAARQMEATADANNAAAQMQIDAQRAAATQQVFSGASNAFAQAGAAFLNGANGTQAKANTPVTVGNVATPAVEAQIQKMIADNNAKYAFKPTTVLPDWSKFKLTLNN